MKSPVGNHKRLEAVELAEGLHAHQCPETGGVWIPARAYWRWLQAQPEHLQHLPRDGEAVEQSDDDLVVKLCPESGTIMFPYRVGHDFNFRIDRSVTCGLGRVGFRLDGPRLGPDELDHIVFGRLGLSNNPSSPSAR